MGKVLTFVAAIVEMMVIVVGYGIAVARYSFYRLKKLVWR